MSISKGSKSDLNVSEIFFSIQGEGLRAGMPCVFVRLQGCELRCVWCDTDYALEIKKQEQIFTIDQIIDRINEFGCKYVTITGGEPLLQKESFNLMEKLCNLGFTVGLETNGHQDVSDVDQRVIKILDLKCPGSGMDKFNNFKNLDFITKNDEIKFVIADESDYHWAKDLTEKFKLTEITAAVHFSSVFSSLSPKTLAGWILRDKLNVRFQLQLHKFIWAPDTRGV